MCPGIGNHLQSDLALPLGEAHATMNYPDGGSDSRSPGSPKLVSLYSGLYNGRLLTAIPYASGMEHAEQCLRSLQGWGVQVSMAQLRDTLRRSALIPELQRYIFLSSRWFGIVLAVVLYVSIWLSLYTTAQIFTNGHSWVISIPVTVATTVVTSVVILTINQHQKKINVNTDLSLAAANEIFMKCNVLLGIGDQSRTCCSVPSLCFIYFHLSGCQQRLSQFLANMRRDDLRRCLDQLFVFVETPVNPVLAQEGSEVPTSEESPLLSSGSGKKPVVSNEKIPLINEGEPHVMAEQLLIITGACYVRLLISGQLPRAGDAGHTGVLDVPCPCQFIEQNILQSAQCSTCV
ncbi:transmembrane protein 268 [Spea bombifrons]|uniref:transmembrane protein 268 n=1 Tax=Spea bombifrons TaxID=233779 RepID=UPI00234A240B|nr:transmembrane protein 268 [Spea bombifrons]